MKGMLLLAAAVVLLGAGWFFVSPLFIDRTVDETFDLTLADGSVDMEMVMSIPPEKRQDMRDQIMRAAAGAADRPADDAMPASRPRALARGEFSNADAIHKGAGQATLYELPDTSHVVRFEDFRTTNGPALVVYLSKHPDPTKAADVADNDFLSLGDLKGNVGNQNYPLPPETDVAQYKSVVIWCELFGVLFSPAPFVPIS